MNRAAIYNRASTKEQAEEGYNLERDEERCAGTHRPR